MTAGLITAVVGVALWGLFRVFERDAELITFARWIALVGLLAWLFGH